MRTLSLLFIALLSLAGCQTLSERSDANKLEKTLDTYASAVRWQPLVSLYSFLQPKLQPATPPTGLDNIRVTNYEVTVSPHQVAEGRVVQTAAIEYVLTDQQVVHTLVDNQLWVLAADGEWQRANPIPDFR